MTIRGEAPAKFSRSFGIFVIVAWFWLLEAANQAPIN